MDIAPAVVTPELASAALASPVLADAIKLAQWIGDGKEVTDEGDLTPALAIEACELLGIELPEGATDDDYVEGHAAVWVTAQAAGFITLNGEVASAAELPTDPEEVLSRWLRVAGTSTCIPDDTCAECVTVLAVLADVPEPVTMLALALVALDDFPSSDEDDDEEDQDDDEDEVSRERDDQTIGHVTSTVLDLRNLGAISVTEFEDAEENTLLLTPLGQMLAATMFASLTPAPGEMAGVVVYRLGRLTPRIAEKIMGPWLAARTTADAAREVLDFAAYARADLRMVATAYVMTLGPDALPAWRERAKDRGVGVYARTWLSEQGEKVLIDGRDLDWMQVERLSARMAATPEPIQEALLADIAAHDPDALPELRRILNRSRHPDAQRLMDTIGAVTGRPAVIARYDSPPAPSTATGAASRLRISLRYVEEPDVWRLVAVDADTTLADLHEIIQAAMGWSDEHLHGFSVGRADIDEAAPLGRVLRKPGDRLLYTYDFGDTWEHDVIFEDYLQNDSGATLPVLVGGSGACPPENCGGAPGYQRLKEIMAEPGHEEHTEMDEWLGSSSLDPDDFSLAKAAAAVSCLQPRRPLTVARVQAKRKKRRR